MYRACSIDLNTEMPIFLGFNAGRTNFPSSETNKSLLGLNVVRGCDSPTVMNVLERMCLQCLQCFYRSYRCSCNWMRSVFMLIALHPVLGISAPVLGNIVPVLGIIVKNVRRTSSIPGQKLSHLQRLLSTCRQKQK